MTALPTIPNRMRELADLSETPIYNACQAKAMWHTANRIIHDVQSRLALDDYEMRDQFSDTAMQILDHLRELF